MKSFCLSTKRFRVYCSKLWQDSTTPRKTLEKKSYFPLRDRFSDLSLTVISDTQLTQCFPVNKRILDWSYPVHRVDFGQSVMCLGHCFFPLALSRRSGSVRPDQMDLE